jgi:hypothetical protein
MKRTIEIRKGAAYYRGKFIDEMSGVLRHSFKLKNSNVFKYVITIVEGSQFMIREDLTDYLVHVNSCSTGGSLYKGLVCKRHFDKLFFPLDEKKTYDITVKKVRK